MFKTFAQIILSLALSLGLVAGFNPEAQAKLSTVWHKAEATIHEVTDSVIQTVDSVSATTQVAAGAQAGVSTNTQVMTGTQADASAQAQEKVEINSATGLNSGLNGLIDGGTSAEGSANVGVEANGSAKMSSGGSFLQSPIDPRTPFSRGLPLLGQCQKGAFSIFLFSASGSCSIMPLSTDQPQQDCLFIVCDGSQGV